MSMLWISKSTFCRNTSKLMSSVRLVSPEGRHLSPDLLMIGPLTLFQVALALLSASPIPKFSLIRSAFGSIGGMGKFSIRIARYGMSKAMAHYLVRKFHFKYGSENGEIVAWCVYPG